jgi:hypothetical protein
MSVEHYISAQSGRLGISDGDTCWDGLCSRKAQESLIFHSDGDAVLHKKLLRTAGCTLSFGPPEHEPEGELLGQRPCRIIFQSL